MGNNVGGRVVLDGSARAVQDLHKVLPTDRPIKTTSWSCLATTFSMGPATPITLIPHTQLTGWAVASAIHYRFDTYTQLANFRGCLFFYIGGKDTIIPAWRGQRLYDNARLKDKGCDSLVVDKNADHCGMPGSPFNNTKVAEKFVKWIESPVF